ncbi:hypothetical protein WJX72_010368 [[Myrmecia] bisecta]|uniref:Non-specific serine/threonine protein kinase n=1 Tax=[Myrmecia] bisecta TaxID=41462 RepID=A0AAW1PU92_9CHLO
MQPYGPGQAQGPAPGAPRPALPPAQVKQEAPTQSSLGPPVTHIEPTPTPGPGPQSDAAAPIDVDASSPQKGEDAAPGSADKPAAPAKQYDIPANLLPLMEAHAEFLQTAGQFKVADLLGSLREVAHGEPWLAYHLWVLVFPIVWATLADKKEQQVHLAKPTINLLSKEYHQRQAHHRPNVVQALLEAISLSQPQPKIPSELIKFLGKTYNAWHIAIPLLESHVVLFPTETRCFDALAELYSMLSAEDVLFGLWKKRCAVPETRAGLACLQHGLVERAQDVFLEAMQKQHAGAYAGSMTEEAAAASKGEQSLWQSQYLSCCAELHQWDVVAEYARSTENYSLLMDCLWKLHDWGTLKEAVLPKAQVEEGPQSLMIKAYVCLQEGAVMEGDARISQAIQKALERWWALPEVGVVPLVPLLAQFQPLVELQESTRILMDLGSAQRPDHQYTDLKDIMETWRLRTPNEWERLSVWSNCMVWRNHIYNIVINAFKHLQEMVPHLHQLGYRDKAWSVNRLGCVARKHGCYETCKNIINNLYGFNAMEVQEAFVKITQQAKAFLHQPDQLLGGLNLINGQNLEYWTSQPSHQAELFRLKAIFLQKLNEVEAASSAFSTSLTLWPQLAEGWLSWGAYCDSMYQAHPATAWLEYAVSSYLQAVRGGSAGARALLPRILQLLSFDNESGAVGKALDRCKDIPLWVWLMWIPQLLMGLQRAEMPHVKRILLQIAVYFPQALYQNLRTFLLGWRENAVKAVQEARARAQAEREAAQQAGAKPAAPAGGDAALQASTTSEGGHPAQSTGAPGSTGSAADGRAGGGAPGASPEPPPIEKPSEVFAFEAGKEVMETLRSKHGILAATLEVVVTEIGSKFVGRAEERLLSVTHALLQRCYKLPYSNSADIPVTIRNELAGVCKACFSPDSVTRHGPVMTQYREHFLRDLSPERPTFPATLGDLAARLKSWKAQLQSSVEDSMPACLRLEEESRALAEQSLTDMEMPGQYLAGEEVGADAVVYLECIASNVAIVRRHGTSQRRLTFVGSDGSSRQFLVQTGQHWFNIGGASDERMMQLLRSLNRLLDKHPESRRRHLAWHTPVVVPIWPQVRLVEEAASYCSYGEAYEINCDRYGREPDLAIVHFKRKCCTATGQLMADPQGELRLQAYREIESKVVGENVFSQYMYKTLPTCNAMWTFKKQFTVQMSLSGLLSHLMLIGGRQPNKILFAKTSGRVFQADFHPVYDGRGLLERNEPVPFRLTRNLQVFFTPFGVEGVFVATMAVAAQAALAEHSNLDSVLGMFFRDDIMAWAMKRVAGPTFPTAQLKTLVQANVQHCLARLRQVAPPPQAGEALDADVQRGAHELVDAATDPRNLCRMDPTWQPWF